MEIREIGDKDKWESFMTARTERTFLNSWNWGEVQRELGRKIWRLGVWEGNTLIGVALVSKVTARRGSHLLLQHNPHLARQENTNFQFSIFKLFVDYLKELGKMEDARFIRINPLWEASPENLKMLKDLGFHDAPMHANAYEATWKLDIRPSEDELLRHMRKTTRYLIRRALKNKDINVVQSDALKDVRIFHDLTERTALKQQFTPFSKTLTEKELEVFAKEGSVLLIIGSYKNEPAAAALVIFWGGIGFYHQAASDPRYAKLSIAYLVQWEAIREAKRRSCEWYDFWGFTDPQKHPNHPWAGPTLFKMGFGGSKREYIKTQDLPLSWKYWVTFAVETLRARKRGY